MSPYLYIYSQTRCRNETKENIAQNVYFVSMPHFSRYVSVTASAEHFFSKPSV
jgi:hypothetical protein